MWSKVDKGQSHRFTDRWQTCIATLGHPKIIRARPHSVVGGTNLTFSIYWNPPKAEPMIGQIQTTSPTQRPKGDWRVTESAQFYGEQGWQKQCIFPTIHPNKEPYLKQILGWPYNLWPVREYSGAVSESLARCKCPSKDRPTRLRTSFPAQCDVPEVP